MADEVLSGIYATALFRVARRMERVREWGENLQTLKEVLERSAALRIFFSAPDVGVEPKRRIIGRVSSLGKFSPQFENFFILLVKRRKIALIRLIGRGYAALANDYFGRLDVEVQSAVPLQDAEKEHLKRVFTDCFKKKVRVGYTVNPVLIAGLMIKTGGKVYDGSLVGQLGKMKSRMLEG